MDNVPKLKCACGNCGEVIEYLPGEVGKIVDCPKCKEKSRLPEPPPFEPVPGEEPPPEVKPAKLCPTCGSSMPPYGAACESCASKRRRTLGLIVGVSAAVVVMGIGWLFLKRFYHAQQPKQPPARVVLQQPRVKTPKSMRDFKISQFGLESKRGSDVVVAVGDIQNVSANLYFRLHADVDLLDARGAKIGTVSDQIMELLPDKTWRFIATVKDSRAKSVRFASLKENQ